MKILSIPELREADTITISNEKIRSVDLMERAALRCSEWLAARFARTTDLLFFCGPGNNGGDGLAMARILTGQGYTCKVITISESDQRSDDFLINLEELKKIKVQVTDQYSAEDFQSADLIIDCLFGSGLKSEVRGTFAKAIETINRSGKPVLSIDVPSGLPDYPERTKKDSAIIHADHTLTFECPKLAFMFPSNYGITGEFTVIHLGLDESFIRSSPSKNYFLTSEIVKPLLLERSKFSHKGSFGHALLVAGGDGKAGASVLAAKATLSSGAGLLTVASPEKNYQVLQTSVPEAMFKAAGETMIESAPELSRYTAIAIGPGIGTEKQTQNVLKVMIQNSGTSLVIDADALNILSENKTWLGFLPEQSILTPHPKEFARLTGETNDDYHRYQLAKEFATKNNVILVLKGAHTLIATPDGNAWFNSTGNPGMAKGGSGDALTGILLGLMSQGYSPLKSALLGVYLHGLAGDLALEGKSVESILATDLINSIGKAYTALKS